MTGYLDRLNDPATTKTQINKLKIDKEITDGWRSNKRCLKSVFTIVPPEVQDRFSLKGQYKMMKFPMAKRFKLKSNLQPSEQKSPSKSRSVRSKVAPPSSTKSQSNQKAVSSLPKGNMMFIRRLASDGNSITYDKSIENHMLYP